MKNCSFPKVIECIEAQNPMYEVTSIGEMEILKRMGVNMSKIIYTNIYKPAETLKFAIENGVGIYAIDSSSDMKRVRSAARDLDERVNVLIRVNPALGGIRDAVFASSVPWSKTGAEICKGNPDCAENLIEVASRTDNFNLLGLHGHLGSQMENLEYYRRFVKSMLDFYAEMVSRYNLRMKTLDLGGGYPVKYEPGKPVPSAREIADVIIEGIEDHGTRNSLIIESGRYVTSNAGTLVTRIVSVKHTSSHDNIAVMDVSTYNHLLDSILVDWYFATEKVGGRRGKLGEVHFVGCTNDSLDHLDPAVDRVCPICGNDVHRKRSRLMPPIKEGDVVAIRNSGAYTTCFNNNYCSIPRCPVLLQRRRGETILVRRQERIGDMLSLNVA